MNMGLQHKNTGLKHKNIGIRIMMETGFLLFTTLKGYAIIPSELFGKMGIFFLFLQDIPVKCKNDDSDTGGITMVKLYPAGAYLVNGSTIIADGPEQMDQLKNETGTVVSKEEAAKNTIAYGILKDHNTSDNMDKLKIKFDPYTRIEFKDRYLNESYEEFSAMSGENGIDAMIRFDIERNISRNIFTDLYSLLNKFKPIHSNFTIDRNTENYILYYNALKLLL